MTFKSVLFDLDGTLLPHRFDDFLPRYFGALQKKFAPIFPDNKLVELVLLSTQEMMRNDGRQTNKEVFWNHFSRGAGFQREELEPLFEEFYRNDFLKLGRGFKKDPATLRVIGLIKQAKRKVILATNPVFPLMAIQERVRWIGLDPEMFDFIACFEEMHFCKPKPDLYIEIAEKINEKPENCLMVGNDVELDLQPASAVGMRTYLVENDFQVPSLRSYTPDFTGDLTEVFKIS